MELHKGRPVDFDSRLPKEQRVYELLDSMNIEYTRVDHEPAMTMEACIAVDEALGTVMCKNLLLCNRQCTDFYLLLMPGDKPFISTFAKFLSIKTPTKINAGAVAQEGTMLARGVRKRHARKQSEVTRLARPVLAPAATPEALSTKVVQVEVPRTEPATVPTESHAIALFISMGSPFSSNIPASVAVP